MCFTAVNGAQISVNDRRQVIMILRGLGIVEAQLNNRDSGKGIQVFDNRPCAMV